MPSRGITRVGRLLVLASAFVFLTASSAACKPEAPTGNAAKPKKAYFSGDDPATAFVMDTPDPFVFYDEATASYYLYATNTGVGFYLPHVPVLRSPDLRTWEIMPDALPDLPPWSSGAMGFTWSPSVLHRPANPPESRYVMYYVSQTLGGQQCIGLATSASPLGPFVDSAAEPFVCQRNRHGSIDPSFYAAPNGKLFLVWASLDNQAGGRATHLWARRLTADGLGVQGNRKKILRAKLDAFEQGVVENPAFLQAPTGELFVFYSINLWPTASYAIGVARCDGPKGPCRRVYRTPVLASRSSMLGPGSPTFFTSSNGKLKVGFHAWTHPYVGYRDLHQLPYPDGEGKRSFHLRGLSFPEGFPKVG